MMEPQDSREPWSQYGHQENAPRLLFVAAEIFPLAKTGGLADVCASLPAAIARLGIDVRLLMPGYTEALERVVAPQTAADLGEVLPGASVRLISGRMPDSGLPVWLVDCPPLFQRRGTLYQDPDGRDWPDNALRFGLFCHVAARVALEQGPPGWHPDIVHAHDWHTGLVPWLMRQAGCQRPRTVFTVHNAAFQGNFPLGCAAQLGLPQELLTPDGIEFYGQLSFLKAGIRYADKVTTVSPSYAREICTPEFGFGMEGLLSARRNDLVGILNGIDAERWNPSTDPLLPHRYSREDVRGKHSCKAALQQHLGLGNDASAPLALFLSRLTSQKMADVVLDRLPEMMVRHPELQFALHGRGERALEEGFSHLVKRYPGRLAVHIGYDEAHAHYLHAGADILLHGSRFEPCGLTQLYAMRYGTIPIVRRVGGLADSVRDAGTQHHLHTDGATGFVFDEPTGEAMDSALSRCVNVYQTRPGRWSALRKQAMSSDFGWSRPARKYARIYAELAPEHTSAPFTGDVTSMPREQRSHWP